VKAFIRIVVLALLLASVIATGRSQPPKGANAPPPWAFPIDTPNIPLKDDSGTLQHVPGSPVGLTLTQIRDIFNVPDWHPEAHPKMPEVVAHGRAPELRACGYCHLPNGLGRPENSSLAGLPAVYFMEQVADFKSGARRSSEPRMRPPSVMAALASFVTDADVKAAAQYFTSLKLKRWVKVVESDTSPKTYVVGGMLLPLEGRTREPLGDRIIETPENPERTELRDASSRFIAYVPFGSVKKGEALVTTGGAGKTTACSMCHGADLRGLGPVPALAGRSPSYVFRQLYDMQHGARYGAGTALMQPVVANLSESDMVAIAAYTGSREP
jgi:cytochrome c553